MGNRAFTQPRRIARLTNAGERTGRVAVLATPAHAELYRRRGGRFLPRWFGAPVAALETVGRRSGRPRSTPVVAAAREYAEWAIATALVVLEPA